MQDDLIAVTQADEDAASEWSFIECRHCSEYEGNFPADLAQAFARHRQQAEDAMRERCAEVADGRVDDDDSEERFIDGWNSACHSIATAIRATPPKPDRLNGEGE